MIRHDDTATIILSATGGITAEDVEKEVSVDDDETAGNIVLDDTATLTIEEGATGQFSVDLSVMPDAPTTPM
ncbi:MAG: hypothetical protein ISN28_13215 [Ectothiorhodospiraceae bacterium AqS1]|nr:hypothetical protein [Ectothiorhodospiraceae bacterium AqS1]